MHRNLQTYCEHVVYVSQTSHRLPTLSLSHRNPTCLVSIHIVGLSTTLGDKVHLNTTGNKNLVRCKQNHYQTCCTYDYNTFKEHKPYRDIVLLCDLCTFSRDGFWDGKGVTVSQQILPFTNNGKKVERNTQTELVFIWKKKANEKS